MNGVGKSVGGGMMVSDSPFPIVNLHLSARDLPNMDMVGLSDPLCVLFIFDNGKWFEFGRTEVIHNNLNPDWVKFFPIMLIFEIRQPIMFRIFDVDSDSPDLSKHDFIGEVQVDLSQIVSQEGRAVFEIKNPKKSGKFGTLMINHEQVENCASLVEMHLSGKDLKKMSWIGSNDPFFTVSKVLEGGTFVPVYQSEVNSKMKWNKFSIPIQILCGNDAERPLKITFYDFHKNNSPKLIGFTETSLSRLTESTGQLVEIKNEKRESTGKFKVEMITINQKYSFYDFLRGGLQLNLITAIDFTASNRDPRDPNSLHFISPQAQNQYEKCIVAVGEILCPYDNDQLFPVFGFGAKIAGIVQHCFPLTFNPNNPNVQGLYGIVNVYHHAITQVQLSGPTLFAPIIKAANQTAHHSFQESRTYTILLIITDGIINDMPDTIDAIVEAGRLPLSIIIVGVGGADFSAMDVLDADDEPLVSSKGEKMCRDLVQFVPFSRFANQHPSALAAAVLDEVPRQLVEWAELNGIRPT